MPSPDDTPITIELVDSVRILAQEVSKRTGGAVDADELFSVGECSLVASAARWDSSLGSFWYFSRIRARGAMLDYLREVDPTGRRARQHLKAGGTVLPGSLRSLVAIDGREDPAGFLDGEARANGLGLAEHRALDVTRIVPALLTLDAVAQFVVWQSVVEEHKDISVAAFLSVTGSRVSQIREKALAALRRQYLSAQT